MLCYAKQTRRRRKNAECQNQKYPNPCGVGTPLPPIPNKHPTIRSLSIQYLPKTKQEAFYPSVRPSIHPPTICSHMVQMAVLTNFIRCKTPEFIVWYGPTGKYNGQNFQQIEKSTLTTIRLAVGVMQKQRAIAPNKFHYTKW